MPKYSCLNLLVIALEILLLKGELLWPFHILQYLQKGIVGWDKGSEKQKMIEFLPIFNSTFMFEFALTRIDFWINWFCKFDFD